MSRSEEIAAHAKRVAGYRERIEELERQIEEVSTLCHHYKKEGWLGVRPALIIDIIEPQDDRGH